MQATLASLRLSSFLAQLGVVAGVYFAAAKLSLLLAIPPGYATAIWPPSGVALAATLLLGNRIWPGIWLGAALVNFSINFSLFAALAIASGNTLEALAAAALVRRYTAVQHDFRSGEDVARFFAIAAASCLIAASTGALSIKLGNALPLPDIFANWWTWWLGDVSGIVVFVPLLLSWNSDDHESWSRAKKTEAACLAVVLLAGAWLAFSGSARYAPPIPRSFLMVPFILWAALRFSQRETAAAVAALCSIAVWHTLEGRGPFAAGTLNASLLLVLIYVNVLAAMGLVLSAVAGERGRAMQQLLAEHGELEARVRKRTFELEDANRRLTAYITARVRAAVQLRDSERRFRLLIDGIQDYAIFMLDAEGRVASWNHGAQKISGYTANEILGRSMECFYTREDAAQGKPRHALAAAAHDGRYEGQELRVRNDGSRYWANVIITALRDESGNVSGYAKITRDVTERRQAEVTSARLAAIVESSEDAILSRDLSGRVVSWNAAAERLLGYTAAEVTGRDLNMVPPERQHEIARNRALLVTGEPVAGYETVRMAKDGRRLDVLLSSSPIKDGDGNVVGMASIIRDIGERKAAQRVLQNAHDELERRVKERTAELSRINAELEKFAYVASHDLQEPLRTVINFSDLLERRYRGKLGTEGQEFLGFIVGSVRRMRQLIDDLLEFSRRGHERLAPQAIDCEALLQRVLVNLAQGAADCGAVVTHDPLPTVVADPGQMEQLFQNLLGNAIKYRGDAPPAIHVGARPRDAGWEIFVRDSGIGIDPRFSERIFEMFQRLHGPGKYAGSGVGLAICKKIVERHGGRIWVQSQEGHGATFHFTLPRNRDDRNDASKFS